MSVVPYDPTIGYNSLVVVMPQSVNLDLDFLNLVWSVRNHLPPCWPTDLLAAPFSGMHAGHAYLSDSLLCRPLSLFGTLR